MDTRKRLLAALTVVATLACSATPAVSQQPSSETLSFARDHRGKAIQVGGALLLPAGAAKVPAVVVLHGSGGVTETREFRYARALVEMGVAAYVLDAFKPRGIASLVADQSALTNREMTDDAFGALQALAQHGRIDAKRIGMIGFSKGGTVAIMTGLERRVPRQFPAGLRFALHVPFYPACTDHYLNPKSTGAPMHFLIGGADTYAGVKPCVEYAEKIKGQGGSVTVTVYPNAKHGFDSAQSYDIANGENWSRCVFEEQADGSWRERLSQQVIIDPQGRRIEAGFKAALAACRTLGVSGGPNPAATSAAMDALKAAVRATLLAGR